MTTWKELFAPGEAEDFFAPLPPRAFDAARRDFDAINAWWLIELSRLVYRDTDRARFLARAELDELHFFDVAEPDTQAFLVAPRARDWAALVFRGTSTLKDFLTNADFKLCAWSGAGEIHRGFCRGFDAVWPAAERALNELPPHWSVFYAGHSLGAALATLAAARRAPAATYTFGSPRVGNRAFAAAVDAAHIHRIVNGGDLVAELPPEWPPLFDFAHVGAASREILRFDALAAFESARDLGGWLAPLLALGEPPQRLADHAPVNYLRMLAATCVAGSQPALESRLTS